MTDKFVLLVARMRTAQKKRDERATAVQKAKCEVYEEQVDDEIEARLGAPLVVMATDIPFEKDGT